MDIKEINDFLSEDLCKVRSFMSASLETDVNLLNRINNGILSHKGKQLRPIVSLLIARSLGSGHVNERSICYAAASELLHNATLLHDDVVDDSFQRRGEPNTMALVGSRASVLIGDFWLVKVMKAIMRFDDAGRRSSQVFSKTFSDLAEGEMLQLQKAGTGDTSIEDYLRIIYCKTASLFEAACHTAAIAAGASDEIEDVAKSYGVNFGMAFQIKDDILDYDGEDIGKPVGMDLMEQKMTLPLLGALSRADEKKEKMVRSMVCEIKEHPEYVPMIRDFVRDGGGVPFACEVMSEYAGKAVSALDPIPECREKEMLRKLAEYIMYREK